MGLRRADWWFAAESRSVAQARASVAESLTDLPEEPLEVVVLLTSELVTNAVSHAVGPVGVHLAWDHREVRVAVQDSSPESPVLRSPDLDDLDGRGLVLVDGLSSDWGVAPGPNGKTVWFTLDV